MFRDSNFSSEGSPQQPRHTQGVPSNPCSIPQPRRASPRPRQPMARSRSLTVSFFSLNPAEPNPTFAPGHFPATDVFNTVKALDRAAPEYRIADGLFASEAFCFVHDDGPLPLIGTYNKDLVSRFLFEHDGDLEELKLDEGWGPVDGSYAMLFANDVVGILSPSQKAPRHAMFANWMSTQGGHPFYLAALADKNSLAQLRGERGLIRRAEFGVQRDQLWLFEEHVSRRGVAGALRQLAESFDGSTSIDVIIGNRKSNIRGAFANDVIAHFEDIAVMLPFMHRAKVYFEGERRPLDLRRSQVASTVDVTLTTTKRVGPNEAAEALLEAYDREHEAIIESVQAWRARRR